MPPFSLMWRRATVPFSLPGLLFRSPRARYRSSCLFGDTLQNRRFIISSKRYASSASTGSFPRVAQPSLWQSIIPKFLRRKPPLAGPVVKSPASREWNPATFFIVIFLLIGSQAIQIIALRNELITYTRKADAKISLLKEVIERVQKGQDVDVQGLLGTGNKAMEKEWEEVLREIEEEDVLWQTKSRRKKESRIAGNSSERDAIPEATDTAHISTSEGNAPLKDPGQRSRRRTGPTHGFY